MMRTLARGAWPETAQDAPESLPQIAGFIVSSFNPLAVEVAERCMRRRPVEESGARSGRRTAIVLASVSGDRATAEDLADAVSTGRRVSPLLFFQSNPNAVLGHIAQKWQLTGPVVCIGLPSGEQSAGIPAEALSEAELLILDGDADEALVIAVEQGTDIGDAAEAVLVDRRFEGEEAH